MTTALYAVQGRWSSRRRSRLGSACGSERCALAMLVHLHKARAASIKRIIKYALLSPPPGRSPWSPVPRVDNYGIGVDPSKRSAPGFAVSGDGGVDPGALRPSHRSRTPTVVDGLERW
eukprot:5649659-Prymnesium_polylepis.1